MASRERELILQKARVWLRKLKVPPALVGNWRRLGIFGLAGLTSLVLGWYASWWLVPVYLGLMSWLVGSPASAEDDQGVSEGVSGGTVEPSIDRRTRSRTQAVDGSAPSSGFEAASGSEATLTKTKRKTVSSRAGRKRARAGAQAVCEKPVAIHFVKVGPGQFVRVEEPLASVEGEEPARHQQQVEADGTAVVVVDDDLQSETILESWEGEARDEPASISREEPASAPDCSETVRSWNSAREGTPAEESPALSGLDPCASVAAPDDLEQQYRGGFAEPFTGGVEDDLPRDPAASLGEATVFEGEEVEGDDDGNQFLSQPGR